MASSLSEDLVRRAFLLGNGDLSTNDAILGGMFTVNGAPPTNTVAGTMCNFAPATAAASPSSEVFDTRKL